MRPLAPLGTRTVGTGLLLLSLGVALRSMATWRADGQLADLLAWMHGGRSALLLAIHVAGMSLLTSGFLGVRGLAAIPVCAFWTGTGALLEIAQHPRVAPWLLSLLPRGDADGGLTNVVSLLIVNSHYSAAELIGALLGGAIAFVFLGEGHARDSFAADRGGL